MLSWVFTYVLQEDARFSKHVKQGLITKLSLHAKDFPSLSLKSKQNRVALDGTGRTAFDPDSKVAVRNGADKRTN